MAEDLYPIDFSFLETTFKDQPDRLKKLLTLMAKEFSTSEETMIAALQDKKVQQYRDIKHKLLPSLNYLQLGEMRDLLEDIKQDIMADTQGFSLDKYEDTLRYFFRSMQVATQQKLATLETTE